MNSSKILIALMFFAIGDVAGYATSHYMNRDKYPVIRTDIGDFLHIGSNLYSISKMSVEKVDRYVYPANNTAAKLVK